MNEHYGAYQTVKNWRDANMKYYQSDTDKLNDFHDKVMKNVFDISLNQVKNKRGKPPSDFCWFVTGSAGRCEQAMVSDQDHGLIYKQAGPKARDYFEAFGKELTSALHFIGYPYCDGRVMSSNLLWNKSYEQWEKQITNWIDEESWPSIRNLLIFFDAKALTEDTESIYLLKQRIFQHLDQNHQLIIRFLDNTMYIKKAVGIFQQLLTETHGVHADSIDLKNAAFLPYVNAVRLLAIHHRITETSTLSRLGRLRGLFHPKHRLEVYVKNFRKLLQLRNDHMEPTENYDDVHYLDTKKLDQSEKQELKQILQDGKKLQAETKRIIQKGFKNEI